jgi:polysaccharide export outer membrane protein
MTSVRTTLAVACAVVFLTTAQAAAQRPTPSAPPGARTAGAEAPGVSLPPGYVIGSGDILSILFWREKDMSVEAATVRPDGKVSLPLLNDIQAAGLTPDELRAKVVEAATKFIKEPDATVVVKEVHSRNVFITGNVAKPSSYPLATDMNVLQLIAQAGGLLEYADSEEIVVIRSEGGRQQYHKFNYKDVVRQKRVEQNIQLRPGDTVVVP